MGEQKKTHVTKSCDQNLWYKTPGAPPPNCRVGKFLEATDRYGARLILTDLFSDLSEHRLLTDLVSSSSSSSIVVFSFI